MGSKIEIKKNIATLKESVYEYLKKNLVLLSVIGTLTGTQVGTVWYFWEIFQALPDMYEHYKEVEESQDHNTELTKHDHQRAIQDSIKYDYMLSFMDTLPKLYMKAERMEIKFIEMKDDVDEVMDDIKDVEDDMKDMDNELYDVVKQVRKNSNRDGSAHKF